MNPTNQSASCPYGFKKVDVDPNQSATCPYGFKKVDVDPNQSATCPYGFKKLDDIEQKESIVQLQNQVTMLTDKLEAIQAQNNEAYAKIATLEQMILRLELNKNS